MTLIRVKKERKKNVFFHWCGQCNQQANDNCCVDSYAKANMPVCLQALLTYRLRKKVTLLTVGLLGLQSKPDYKNQGHL